LKPLGILYIVATPIGNLDDVSTRMLATLRAVDYIAAEDTRHSGRLLQHFSITTRMLALHEHNEAAAADKVIELLRQGQSIALISDAGTPLISDPGRHLVQQALSAGVRIMPIPGPSALITALSASGLLASQFIFEGFLPAKDNQRRQRLSALARETRTMVFYEAPHRIIAVLSDMMAIFGENRQAVLAKELTKLFETIKSAPLTELKQWLLAEPERMQGEFVVLVKGDELALTDNDLAESERILKILMTELPAKQAVSLTAKITGVRKNLLYKISLGEAE
jgi:16S rRNA (cytidine1402-2'-O)-methyltransferase